MDAADVSAFAACVSAATTVALAILTAWYVRITKGMVAEMRAARQPVIFIDAEILDGSEVILLIGNSGDAPGRQIRFEIEDGIPWDGTIGRRPADLRVLRDGMPYLAPDRVLRFRLGHLDWKATTTTGGSLSARIRFEGEEGRRFDRTAHIDLSRYEGMSIDTFTRYEERAVEKLGDLHRLAQEVVSRTDPTQGLHAWCAACRKPIPCDARKCHHCFEWISESQPPADNAEANAPAS